MRMWRSAGPKSSAPLNLTDISVVPLTNAVAFNTFDCGVEALNRFLKNKAVHVTNRLEFRVFAAVLNGSNKCIGYYALQLGSDTIPEKFKKSSNGYISNYSAFPAVHLSYLAVDPSHQRNGLGSFLMLDVFEKVATISDYVGFYALTLQSFNGQSTSFYQRVGFTEYSEGGGQPKMLYPLAYILEMVRAKPV